MSTPLNNISWHVQGAALKPRHPFPVICQGHPPAAPPCLGKCIHWPGCAKLCRACKSRTSPCCDPSVDCGGLCLGPAKTENSQRLQHVQSACFRDLLCFGSWEDDPKCRSPCSVFLCTDCGQPQRCTAVFRVCRSRHCPGCGAPVHSHGLCSGEASAGRSPNIQHDQHSACFRTRRQAVTAGFC